jgi:plastocyanin
MQATTTLQQESSFPLSWLLIGMTALIIGLVGTLVFLRMDTSLLASPAPAHTITLTTETMSFATNEFRVKVGESVTINLTNNSFVPHSFDIDEFDIHAGLGMQGKNSISFTATEVGEFKFYCGVEGHENAGMFGTLIIEE